MGLRWITLEDRAKMPLFTLTERTYLDAKGKATTDEAKAASLLGIEGDEILAEEAYAAGLLKTEPKAEEAAGPEMLYYDADGNQVDKDDPAATRQWLSDSPDRPDSPERKAAAAAAAKAAEGTAETPLAERTDYGNMRKAELVELAEARGVTPTDGQNIEHYVAALKADDESKA